MTKIIVAKDFSDTPGGRYINEGEFSGELFRKQLLASRYQEALDLGEKLIIDFDGCFGYATSFLEESFGGLVRERGEKGILNHMKFISNDDLTLPDSIEKYVKKAEETLN